MRDRVDELLDQLVDPNLPGSTHDRLRDLVRVTNLLTSDLDLDSVLRRLVEVALELVGAQYAALGVLGEDGQLEQFLHVGMNPATVTAIGHYPAGAGLLGALVTEPGPIRLAQIADDERFAGYPEHHPVMQSFLGVPIRVRQSIYGTLYLADSVEGEFTVEDEIVVQALAATAGIAIANARLYEDSLHRQNWSLSLAEATRRLLSDDDDDDQVPALLETVRGLSFAQMAGIFRLDPAGEELTLEVAVGPRAGALVGATWPAEETTVAPALVTQEITFVHDLRSTGMTNDRASVAAVLPFVAADGSRAAMMVARENGPMFAQRDIQMLATFATHAGMALDRADARRSRRRVSVLEDRHRIARDLHDHVIQRLFATGLGLEATARGLEPEVGKRISAHVQEIDGAITQIRQSIFALSTEVEDLDLSLRTQVLAAVERLEQGAGCRPIVGFVGPVDLLTDADLAQDVIAVVAEGLSNAVKHAEATNYEVSVGIEGRWLRVTIVDNGIGVPEGGRRSGLRNLAERARRREGELTISTPPDGGTRLEWSARL